MLICCDGHDLRITVTVIKNGRDVTTASMDQADLEALVESLYAGECPICAGIIDEGRYYVR